MLISLFPTRLHSQWLFATFASFAVNFYPIAHSSLSNARLGTHPRLPSPSDRPSHPALLTAFPGRRLHQRRLRPHGRRNQDDLLHGDLWGGNASFDRDGAPVLFDPATYYGDRETDLAFTEMFGGFGPPFYEAYHKSYPLDPGFSRRKILYNLYHILNHYNLFGGSYANQAQAAIDHLLRI